MTEKRKKLSFKEKFCFGLGDGGANVFYAFITTFMTAYYTDNVGIAAGAIATMMLISRVFDGITDLIMGAIVDRTHTRWGKARPWVLWTAPFMTLGMIALFNVPANLTDTGKLVYAYITYILMTCFIYTANNLPYSTILSRMTLDVQDRASASSIRFVCTQVVTLLVNSVSSYLLVSAGYRTLSIVYGIIMLVMLLICFFGTKEHLGEEEERGESMKQNVPLKVGLKALVKNKYFFLQTLLFCAFFIGFVASGGMVYYYCDSILEDLTVVTLVSMSITIPSTLINFAMPGFVSRWGKQKVMIFSSFTWIVGGLLIVLGDTILPVVVVGLIFKGSGVGLMSSCITATTSDIVDYGEWKTGIRTEGLVNSCSSFGMKIGIGLGSFVSAGILSICGYEGKAAVQTASALAGIRFGFGWLVTIAGAACLVICLLLNLDKYIKQIQEDLEKKHMTKK